MAKISDKLRLTPSEVDQLMQTEARLRIATVGPGEKINLTPMTFGWANGKVYIYGRGQKVANLRRSSTATVLMDIGEAWRELKGIMMHGEARVLESQDDEQADPDLEAARHNLGEKSGLKKDGRTVPYEASASGNSRRWIVFKPTDVVSWNNEKL